jgi:hypothetical protein
MVMRVAVMCFVVFGYLCMFVVVPILGARQERRRWTLKDDEKVTSEEFALLIRPALDKLISKHGEQRAIEILRISLRSIGVTVSEVRKVAPS